MRRRRGVTVRIAQATTETGATGRDEVRLACEQAGQRECVVDVEYREERRIG